MHNQGPTRVHLYQWPVHQNAFWTNIIGDWNSLSLGAQARKSEVAIDIWYVQVKAYALQIVSHSPADPVNLGITYLLTLW